MTNIAALILIASTFLERLVDFWAAYLLGPVSLAPCLGLLFIYRKSFGEASNLAEFYSIRSIHQVLILIQT